MSNRETVKITQEAEDIAIDLGDSLSKYQGKSKIVEDACKTIPPILAEGVVGSRDVKIFLQQVMKIERISSDSDVNVEMLKLGEGNCSQGVSFKISPQNKNVVSRIRSALSMDSYSPIYRQCTIARLHQLEKEANIVGPARSELLAQAASNIQYNFSTCIYKYKNQVQLLFEDVQDLTVEAIEADPHGGEQAYAHYVEEFKGSKGYEKLLVECSSDIFDSVEETFERALDDEMIEDIKSGENQVE